MKKSSNSKPVSKELKQWRNLLKGLVKKMETRKVGFIFD